MFCLRSWLPLLFIPTNASPLFILSFVTLTYILHRPCIYCSALLLILFISSCHWSDRCFFDIRADWFAPRFAHLPAATSTNATTTAPALNSTTNELIEYVFDTVNTTATALMGAALEEAKRCVIPNGSSSSGEPEWTGIGLEWFRSLLGRREWTLPCVDVKVRL
ncbi:conserved hypothetical protein [Microsporum canis CBS 113480]|uniref:Uncharacterized protein n=1 Tax=Arthroderma otae (strain ATCC MYA-4605 / CBS 113480) TaxID=554155 RepID=C5FRM9_ARTOC|nr:conserved hypothetical protein [Microsporum canis CBS 113480]EEQ32532.1 conserved hypothetical protein [Microsporum canis CBS 113480]